MKFFKSTMIFLSILVRWFGLALGATGIIGVIWFFVLSQSDTRYYWGVFSLVQTYAGFLIFRYGFERMYNEFDNYR